MTSYLALINMHFDYSLICPVSAANYWIEEPVKVNKEIGQVYRVRLSPLFIFSSSCFNMPICHYVFRCLDTFFSWFIVQALLKLWIFKKVKLCTTSISLTINTWGVIFIWDGARETSDF